MRLSDSPDILCDRESETPIRAFRFTRSSFNTGLEAAESRVRPALRLARQRPLARCERTGNIS
jgi:hypothetical protein